MKALLALALALVGFQVSAATLPDLQGNFSVVPGKCDFNGVQNITSANVTLTNSNNGPVVVLKIIGVQTGTINFYTKPFRQQNPNVVATNPYPFIDTNAIVSQTADVVTNIVNYARPDGTQSMEAMIQIVLDPDHVTLKFQANEADGTQSTCIFMRH